MSDDLLGPRVRSLIDLYDRGSIRAAAARSGVALATLARLVKRPEEPGFGETRPRSDVLDKIAGAYAVDLTWLIRGEGRGPDVALWAEGVAALGKIDDVDQFLLLTLPEAFARFCAAVGLAAPNVPASVRHRVAVTSSRHRMDFAAALADALKLPGGRARVLARVKQARDMNPGQLAAMLTHAGVPSRPSRTPTKPPRVASLATRPPAKPRGKGKPPKRKGH